MNFQGRKATASMVSKVKTDAKFELSGPDYPQDDDFEGSRCKLNFQGRKTMASKAKTEAKFGLSSPDDP